MSFKLLVKALSIEASHYKTLLNDIVTEIDPDRPEEEQLISYEEHIIYGIQSGQFKTLRQLLQSAIEEYDSDTPWYRVSIKHLGTVYNILGEYGFAESALKHSLEIERVTYGENHPEYAKALHRLARVYNNTGDYGQAEPLILQALEIVKSELGELHQETANCLQSLGDIYINMGDYAEAETAIRQARTIWEHDIDDNEDVQNYDFIVMKLLYIYCQTKNINAIQLEATGDNPNPTDTDFISRHKIGVFLENILHKNSLIDALVLSGFINDKVKDTADYLRNQLELIKNAAGEQHPVIAKIMAHRGDVNKHLSNFILAESNYRESLEITKNFFSDNHQDYADTLMRLGDLYVKMGDFKEAESILNQASEIFRLTLGEANKFYVDCLLKIASLNVKSKSYKDAFSYLLKANSNIDAWIGKKFSTGSIDERKTFIVDIQNYTFATLTLLHQHLSHQPQIVEACLDFVLRRKALGAESNITGRYAILGEKYPELLTQLQDLDELNQEIIEEEWYEEYGEIIHYTPEEFIKRHNGLTYEEYKEKSLHLFEWSSRMRHRKYQRDRQIEYEGERRKDLWQKSQRMLKRTTKKRLLEAKLARHIPEMDISNQLKSVNTRLTTKSLPERAILIEIIRISDFDFDNVFQANFSLKDGLKRDSEAKEDRYLAFVLHKKNNNSPQVIDLGKAETIDKLISSFRTTITGEGEGRGLFYGDDEFNDEHEEIQQELWKVVFEPIEPLVKNHTHLIFSPDSNLSQIPFEILTDGSGKQLIDKYTISYLTTGRDILHLNEKPLGIPRQSIVIADPDYDFGYQPTTDGIVPRIYFNRLKATQYEGEQVAKLMNAIPLSGEKALASHIKRLTSPFILHIATHGYYLPPFSSDMEALAFESNQVDLRRGNKLASVRGGRLTRMWENPLMRTGLAFAGANSWLEGNDLPNGDRDALLNGEDISKLDLRATELVVLSACETGLGDLQTGEGVLGLQRALKVAGAKTLIISLWKVPDAQTKELMIEFYNQLLGGQSRSEALRIAKIALRKKYPDPYYWGAFVCQGDPRALPEKSLGKQKDLYNNHPRKNKNIAVKSTTKTQRLKEEQTLSSSANKKVEEKLTLPKSQNLNTGIGKEKFDILPPVGRKILNVLKEYSSLEQAYIYPNIPTKKQRNLSNECNVPQGEKILGLIDSTSLGSAKLGLLIGCQGIYYKNPKLSFQPGAHTIPYDEFSKRIIKPGGFLEVGIVLLGKEERIEFDGYNVSKKVGAEILQKIKEVILSEPNLKLAKKEDIAIPLSSNQKFKEGMIKILEEYSDLTDFHLLPNIPQKKSSTLSRRCKVPQNEEILALIDTSLFGTARHGLLIGMNGIYYKNDDEVDPNFIPYDDFSKRTFKSGRFWMAGEVSLDKDQKLSLAGSGAISKNTGVEILNKIKSFVAQK